jgi:hypothetical protein
MPGREGGSDSWSCWPVPFLPETCHASCEQYCVSFIMTKLYSLCNQEH